MEKFVFNAVLLVVSLLFVIGFFVSPVFSSPPNRNVSSIDSFREVHTLKKIRLDSCAVLDKPGKYVLIKDIVPSLDNKKCIDIQSDNVIFDCQGHSITNEEYGGTNSYAIYSDKSNFTIRNCKIDIQGGGNGGAGIMMEHASDFIIDGNTINDNAYGIYGSQVKDGIIRNNNFDGNFWHAIFLSTSEGNLIEDNNVKNNIVTNGGITISTSKNNKILNNELTRSQLSLVFESSNNVLDGNRIFSSQSSGVYIHVDSNNNTLKSILIQGGFIGIDIDNSKYNIVKNSTVMYSDYGLYIHVSPGYPKRSDNNVLGNVVSIMNNVNLYLGDNVENTRFIDGSFGSYEFLGNTFNVVKRKFGFVEFLEKVKAQGNLDNDIIVNNNYVKIGDSLNKSTLISLFNMPGNFTNPVIYKDGSVCGDCDVLSSLNSRRVFFKVSGAGEYWIGEL